MKSPLRLVLAAFGLAIFNLSTVVVQAEDYLYETNNGTITITQYIGPGGNVIIPDKINGLPVTSIEVGAFCECTDLTSIIIPNNVTNIGDYAFAYCTSLSAITIPSSMSTIGFEAFTSCAALTAILVDPLNPTYNSTDGVLFDKSLTTLIQFPGGKAGGYMLPNTITTIKESAFHDCPKLASVEIPSSVTNIGVGAFAWCTGLSHVTIGTGVTSIPSETFFYCTSLTNVSIPDRVTSIGAAAFSYCTSLTSITIPSRVISIGSSAFGSCTNLTAARFHGGAPRLPEWYPLPFSDCPNVTIYYLPGTTGWSATYSDRPTAPWLLPYPVILTTTPNFGIQTSAIAFRISWATNASVVVEASTTLENPVWSPLSTNTLTDGWCYFSDAEWTNYPARFYRVRSQ